MMAGDSLSAAGLVYILVCMLQGGAQLWQICVGVTVSSVFSSLMDPAYKATVSDLLSKEQYTKASGLVQAASSAKYLISPILAGFLLQISDIKLLLAIDICTFWVTVAATVAVRRGLASKKHEAKQPFIREFKDGWGAVSENKGVLVLVLMTSVIVFFLGFIQTLATPMILSFTDSSRLGTVITIAASGMLVTSVMIGMIPIKRGHVNILSVSLCCAGIFMGAFGLRENLVLISVSGFLFFGMLPFANTSLDYLIRSHIGNSVQGRAWGLIGLISQLGYVAAYSLSGVLADVTFTPLLLDGGTLAGSVGRIIGTGSGRGAGLLIILGGALLCVTSGTLYRIKSVRQLETRGG